VRFTDEELKHQELFRRIEHMIAEGMPAGYKSDQPKKLGWWASTPKREGV